MTTAKVIFKDLGITKLKDDLTSLKEHKVTIGFQGASGRQKHPNADASVATVAKWQEYGTPGSDDKLYDQPRGRIPSRPFVRTAMSSHQREIHEALRTAISDIVDQRATMDGALDAVGEKAVGFVRETMERAKSWAKPLSESTIERKGHDTPLIDSKAMLNAVSWAIRQAKTKGIIRQGGEQ